jgi:hypothetical protein
MKALIWKELRENIRWALLAVVALGGAEIYALYYREDPYQVVDYFRSGITLCREQFLTATLFGCAAAGLLLGLLQVLPELKRDRWAALLHRPVSRGRFFWSKTLAGALLYLLATGLPFAVCVWLVATPGHFATPFLPAMIRPGLADIFAGLAYYFAALLLALQGGKILLRVLPLFAAIHLSFFALDAKLFRVAIEAALAMAAVLCLAGWGAMHARDSWRARPWIARAAFLIAIFYGACGAGDLLQALGGLLGRSGPETFSNWGILNDGTPARVTYRNEVAVSVTDVEGKPLTDRRYQPDRIRNQVLYGNTATSYIGDAHGWKPRRYENSYRQSNTYLYSSSPYQKPRFEQWFQLVEKNLRIGFLPLKREAFATLGSHGFGPPDLHAPGFSTDVRAGSFRNDVLSIADGDTLRFAYLGKREIVSVPLPEPGKIFGTCNAWMRLDNSSISFLGVALARSMAVYDGDAQLIATLPYRHDVERWGTLALLAGPQRDRYILQYEPSAWIEEKVKRTMPSFVDNVDAQGRVLASFTLPPLPPAIEPPDRAVVIAQRLQSPAFIFGEMLYRKLGAALGSTRLRDALHRQLSRDLSPARDATLLALVLGGVTLFWARRAQLPPPRAGAWALAVLCFGLPGFVTFWLAGERPFTIGCAACGRPRRIEDAHCAHCGAEWPEPVLSGLEIFDRQPL